MIKYYEFGGYKQMSQGNKVRILAHYENTLQIKEYFPRLCSPRLHKHLNKEIFHITKGTGFLHINQDRIPLEAGMKVQVEPRVLHSIETTSDELECITVIQGVYSKEIHDMITMFS